MSLEPASLSEAASLIRSRQLSPVQLVEACLERIASSSLNAFISVQPEAAMAAARQAQEAVAKGNYKGPLHGIPIAGKDNIDVLGVPTTAGSRIMNDRLPGEDAFVVAKLRAAGAIIIGKTNLHEFACGTTGVNPHFGPVRNPWDTQRITGGSSSGSAAAVASGEALAALGTDTGGSIRIPAAFCGVVGLKPTYGRVSNGGTVPLSSSLDHVGPLCRNVEDAATVLQAIAGLDPSDGSSVEMPVPDYQAALASGVAGLRIGVPREFFFEGLAGDVDAALREAVRVFEKLGAQLSEVSLPQVDQVSQGVLVMLLSEALAYHETWLAERPQDYGEDVRLRLEVARKNSAVDYINARRLKVEVTSRWRQLFQEIDLLLTPTTTTAPPSISEAQSPRPPSFIKLTNPFNFSGQPAISLPCGFTSEGLPIGMQLVGRAWEETTILRAALAYEQATGWHKRRPPRSS